MLDLRNHVRPSPCWRCRRRVRRTYFAKLALAYVVEGTNSVETSPGDNGHRVAQGLDELHDVAGYDDRPATVNEAAQD